jgi:SPX domain protein involved in polyphosphate accumulation
MKFGHNFHLYQVPEWESFYLSYNQLKKLFNIASKKASHLRTKPDYTGPSTNHLLLMTALMLT